jgi:hypothetical protein
MATSSVPRAPSIAFQKALDRFTNSLSEEQKRDWAVTSYEDVEDAIDRIQCHYGDEKSMQSMFRLESFLEAMKEYGTVVELFLNCTPFVAYIWVCTLRSLPHLLLVC